MKKNTKFIFIFAIILLIFAIIFFVITHKSQPTVEQHSNAEEAAKKTEISDADLKEIKEKEKSGPKVIIFWSMDNEDSVNFLKLINKNYLKSSSKVLFTAINKTDNPTNAAVFLKSNGIDIPNQNTETVTIPIVSDEQKETPSVAFILKDNSLLSFVNSEGTFKGDETKSNLTISDISEDTLNAYIDLLTENY